MLGDEPAELGSDPGERQDPKSSLQEQPALSNAPAGSKIESNGKESDEKEAEPHHDPERPEYRRDGRYRIPGGLVDLRRSRLRGVLHVLSKQERVAEILYMLFERLPSNRIARIIA